ncbi:MAG: hypothetical protein CM15mP83_4630 [Flavobacteriaceae bacterium]|nr:MAG: hypothetical protein CM15mP83_4630 [Flavobacteriaceae bacterium]
MPNDEKTNARNQPPRKLDSKYIAPLVFSRKRRHAISLGVVKVNKRIRRLSGKKGDVFIFMANAKRKSPFFLTNQRFITTTKDEKGRKTVMDLIANRPHQSCASWGV